MTRAARAAALPSPPGRSRRARDAALGARAAACAAALAACSGATDPGAGGRLYLHATNLVLAAGDTTSLGLVLERGRSYRHTAPTGYEPNWPADRAITWATSDAGVAAISPAGVVTAVRPGRVIVTASSAGLRDTATLTVTAGPPAPAAFAAVGAGTGHACGLTAAGAVLCSGLTWQGEAGQGTVRRFTHVVAPAPVASATRFAALAVGFNHTCALATDGRAHCWGDNAFGQLGAGGTANRAAPTPAARGQTFTALSAGADQTCGLTPAGRVVCWGRGADGRTEVAGPQSAAFTALTVGAGHRCALAADGAAYCWGDNGFGQLGTGDAQPRGQPTPVAGDHRFRQLSAGADHTCGVRTDGAALCWGWGASGRLGTGAQGAALAPVPVASALRFTAIDAGTVHTCAVAEGGAAYCWGDDLRGQLGDGPPPETPTRPDPGVSALTSLTPVRVAGAQAWRAVSAGADVTCGLTADDRAYCWGNNANGALGAGAKGWAADQPRSVRHTPAAVAAP
jgi:alpha-tubulin suppressor-like RCC1 family protein